MFSDKENDMLNRIVLSIEGLLNHAQVTIEGDSSMGINTVWSLSKNYSSVISDISVNDIQWAVQSRPADVSVSWDTTIFEKVLNFMKIM